MLYNLFENRDFVSVFAVALLAEGVDRNAAMQQLALSSWVALLAEGVDRNLSATIQMIGLPYRLPNLTFDLFARLLSFWAMSCVSFR